MSQNFADTLVLRRGVDAFAQDRMAVAEAASASGRVAAPAIAYDVCVVGAGPVGITVALECAERGLKVVLVEAGHDGANPPASDASTAEIVDPRRHVGMDLAVRRGLGGTSWLWGGRCVPFDPIDFEARDFIPESGWPIGHADLQPWYEAASRYLDCGDVARPSEGADERMESFAKQAKRALLLKAKVESHPLIDIVLETPVTGLDLDDGSVEGLLTAAQRRLKARFYVLACGGLETARLLLAAQRLRPRLFGGANGALGRYYAGHFEGAIANVVLGAEDLKRFDFHVGSAGAYCRRVMTIPEARQREERIQNIVFWPNNLPFHDPRSKSGIKSLVYLLASMPRVGPRLVPEAIRLGIVGKGPRRYLAHVMNILRTPIRTSRDVYDVIHDRFISKWRRPGWLLPTQDNKYVLHYRAEQRPNRDSRVTLSDHVDGFGMPRLQIDLRYTEDDARAALRAHELLDDALRASGRGHLEYLYPEGERVARILDQASDGYHQTGTTRMGTDPKTSVVGADCRVHGLSNLFVASSSVFATSGHANPTLLATAIGARLAAHLHQVAVGAVDVPACGESGQRILPFVKRAGAAAAEAWAPRSTLRRRARSTSGGATGRKTSSVAR